MVLFIGLTRKSDLMLTHSASTISEVLLIIFNPTKNGTFSVLMINNLERQGFDKKSSTMRRILQKYDKNPAEFQRAVARDIETEYSEYVDIT